MKKQPYWGKILETEFMNIAEINQTIIFIIGTIIWYVTYNSLVQIKIIRIIFLMFPEFPRVRWEKKGGGGTVSEEKEVYRWPYSVYT